MQNYIITTAVPGCKPNKSFINSLLGYAKKHKAKLLVLPSQSLYADDVVDPYILANLDLVSDDRKLNSNLHISSLPINPEAEDPVTGLGRHAQQEGSLILASPKQRLESIASPSQELPRVVMTTGACTHPNYRPTKKGIIANKDHVAGAIIVEVENSRIYHFRQIQASTDGSFVDLGIRYKPNGATAKVQLEALVPGDWHVGSTDDSVRQAVIGFIKQYNPKHLILHDFFDGLSINHHLEHKLIQQARLARTITLEQELQMARQELTELTKIAKNVVVVKSNHDEFLDKYLDEGKFLHDKQNLIIGLKLAYVKAVGGDALKFALSNNQSNLTFLTDTDSFKVTPKQIELGVHGHRGPNGARGSSKSLERAYGAIVHGHTHSPSILREAFCVGTSTKLQLDYNKGASSWMQTMCFVYADGSRQLINVINGKCRA